VSRADEIMRDSFSCQKEIFILKFLSFLKKNKACLEFGRSLKRKQIKSAEPEYTKKSLAFFLYLLE